MYLATHASGSSSSAEAREGNRLRRAAVERAEAYVRAHPDAPAPLHTLCRIVGLSERGLRNAFNSVRGMSPTRCMLAARLQGVRRALNDACERPTTVTTVATGYRFCELGRFARQIQKGVWRGAL